MVNHPLHPPLTLNPLRSLSPQLLLPLTLKLNFSTQCHIGFPPTPFILLFLFLKAFLGLFPPLHLPHLKGLPITLSSTLLDTR